MQLSLKRVAIASGIAATVVAIGAAQAMAAPTYTVKIGTTATGSGTYTAASTTSLVLTDTTKNQTVTCASGTAAGAVPHLGAATNPLATITSTTWGTSASPCKGPAGLSFTVTQAGTWSLNGTVATTTGGVTAGQLTGVSATIAAPGCSFKVTGTVNGSFTNSSQVLAIAATGSTLTTSAVSGCFGLVANGDAAKFVGSYKVSAKTSGGTAGALTITSP